MIAPTELFDPRLWLGGAVLLLMLLGAACAGKQAASTSGDAAVPDDLHIILGTTGMATGGMQGWSIRGDGSVMAWAGKAPEAEVRATGTLAPEQVADLWAAVQEVGFFDIQEQAMVTRAAFINVTAQGQARRVSWARPLGSDGSDTALEQLYTRLQEAASAALD